MQFSHLTTLMASLSAITFAGQALAQGPITLESVSGCAAVVSTTSVCPTCVTLQCIVQATVTAGCDSCPVTAVPTIYREYPCEGPCPDGCRTDYTVLTAEADMCGDAGANITPTPTDGETPTTESTVPVTTTSGVEVTSTGTETTTQDVIPSNQTDAETTTGTVITPSPSTAGAARMKPLRWW
ncbi:hypothetical protein VTJ04DRAFT_5370 [Mycothermus thermophilus]|uniref:uncharacterized protein n=1 Tax=Humicola insolens TaxID=85995 RepID=UPI003742D217